MFVMALIITLVGAIGWLLKFSGFSSIVRPVDDLPLSVWAGVFIVGLVVMLIARRPSD